MLYVNQCYSPGILHNVVALLCSFGCLWKTNFLMEQLDLNNHYLTVSIGTFN